MQYGKGEVRERGGELRGDEVGGEVREEGGGEYCKQGMHSNIEY